MLYKDGKVVGFDGEEIRKNALSTVLRYQKIALNSLTKGEQGFCKLIGPVCKHARVRYVKQRIEYVTQGVSFRVDFLFKEYHIVVEIDGNNHLSEKALAVDAWRSRLLKELADLTVIRFTNRDVAEKYLWVREQVVDALIASPYGTKRHLLSYRRNATLRNK